VAAVRFAGSWEELAGPLLALAWELAVRPAPAQRACAAALAGALVPCLPLQQARARPAPRRARRGRSARPLTRGCSGPRALQARTDLASPAAAPCVRTNLAMTAPRACRGGERDCCRAAWCSTRACRGPGCSH